MAENKDTDLLNNLEKQEYKYGFTTDIETCLLYTSPSPRD